jgi:hypothetical protein
VCTTVSLVCLVEDSGVSGDCVSLRRVPVEGEYSDRLNERRSEVR